MSSSEKTVNLSNRLTPATAVKKRAGGLLAEKLRQKGWSITSAALYLGVSRQRLYSVFADPGRARLWSCAVEGIPHFSPQIAELLKSLRSQRVKQKNTLSKIDYKEFELGDVVMCTKYAGIAEEDEKGHVGGLKGSDQDLKILVVMPNGKDWFPREIFHNHFSVTGLVGR